MNRHLLCLAVGVFSLSHWIAAPLQAEKPEKTVLDHKVESLDGNVVDLSQYKGKVVMIVNVASRCGATPQYAAMQDVYETFKNDGFVMLGFPCNQFGRQEPGSAAEIREFCSAKYGVSFPMMAKIDVKGDSASPIYQALTATETAPKKAGVIGWNFEKFLIGRNGQVVARYGTSTEPDAPEVVAKIKEELARK